MRTLSAGMAAHLKSLSHTRCWMVRIALADGTVVGLTDHDRDLNFDIGAGPDRYRSSPGFILSDVVQTAGFDVDNFELSVPLQAVGRGAFTLQAVEGGRFHHAQVHLFEINWKDPAQGPVRWVFGNITEARPDGLVAVLEVRSEKDKLNQTVGEVTSLQCRTWYGSPRCGKAAETATGTVSSVVDDMAFTLTVSGGPFADDYFNAGTLQFTSGALAGTRKMDVHDWYSTGAVMMYEALVAAPAIGDSVVLTRGCPRNRPACMARSNIVNYQGEPDMTGSDKLLRPTIPGSNS